MSRGAAEAVSVRRAGPGDLPAIRPLWEEFEAEVPEPAHRAGEPDESWAGVCAHVESGLALVAELDGQPVGYALARLARPGLCHLGELYVRPEARRGGVAKALLLELAAWGAEGGARTVTLEVTTANATARAVYERLGFSEESRNLHLELPVLAERVSPREGSESFGSVHVQTDDLEAVVRAVSTYLPRLPGSSRGGVVLPPRNGWTAVFEDLCDRDPEQLGRLARELSDRLGAVVLAIGVEESAVVRYTLLERGLVVDEYASVPEYHGARPPGEVIALAANPTVLARLTGADPRRIREVARTASSPGELPAATELLAAIAVLIGVDGAVHGYDSARSLPGARPVGR